MKRLSAFLIIFLVINLLFGLVINSRIGYAMGTATCVFKPPCGDYKREDCESPEYPGNCYEEHEICQGGGCIPEFSDYAGIIALIGAIIIPTLIYKFRKKK